ncbi:MAG: inner membrane CreD family protein [Anaerolineae bacterium]|nr:inner membrane CreD family protein [Anaerolineae bacterium]
MKPIKRVRTVFINGVLVVGILVLLGSYFAVVNDLPARVYTDTQREYLAYNSMRSVAQLPPTWKVVQTEGDVVPAVFPGQDSRVRATLVARYEEHEGVSATLYDLDFSGEYRLTHSGPLSTTVELFFPFPSNLETLHDVRLLVDGEEPPNAGYSTSGISWRAEIDGGQERRIEISYRADGANSFTYGLPQNQRADVDIVIAVEGLTGSTVLKSSLPASGTEITGDDGEVWTWHYDALIADRDIRLDLPVRLSFSQRVAQLQDDFRALAGLAPFLVGFFVASLAGVLTLCDVRLRLVSYLLVGLGLALFYPLLTFLSGVVDVTLASVLSSVVVSGLLVVFLSLAVGWKRAGWRVGLLLIIFLGFFSLGMLTAWRGLFLTGGGLLLVGTFMLLYARRSAVPVVEPADVETEPAAIEIEPVGDKAEPRDVEFAFLPSSLHAVSAPEAAPALAETEVSPQPEAIPVDHHCPYCARALEADYAFCPSCGQDTSRVHRCAHCGHQQFVPEGLETVYCVRCGELIDSSANL